MENLKIVYLAPEELTPYEKNTRRHTPTDIEQIKTSILRCGFDDPIGIWGEKKHRGRGPWAPDRREGAAAGPGAVHSPGSYDGRPAERVRDPAQPDAGVQQLGL